MAVGRDISVSAMKYKSGQAPPLARFVQRIR